ncbi:hypothetical protein PF005_g19092 [Phytophthora fragariae]|uniref:Uncharacterized protein n=1 Tax=Phytophthora fragariae TaxID=53985 RepID=A0A6A3ECF9_9STRA|nr:hypothetical protein PF003_g38964 [Phytophthora fragariae]KAE8931215.1 hypothetical protein PF009_g18720 [Phytophthora fragariae]KAE8976014.1 hypothetical protein PF011_g24228 [Phytophthora fragariae]KAE9090643.1 hypothetical protein PF007_g19165 [Phytophthora fragariae]KAE9105634.1 hypothetical protein PF010_g12943 [Phytophthora fragariae]
MRRTLLTAAETTPSFSLFAAPPSCCARRPRAIPWNIRRTHTYSRVLNRGCRVNRTGPSRALRWKPVLGRREEAPNPRDTWCAWLLFRFRFAFV